MATVYLLSAAPHDRQRSPHGHDELEELQRLVQTAKHHHHVLTDDPTAADIVLFVESSTEAGAYFELVRRHEIYRAHRAKSYLFSSTDRIVPFLPGVYASIERSWYRDDWVRPGMYLGIREGGDLRYDPQDDERSYLYSFVGSTATHPVRRRLVRVTHPDALLIDTASEARADDSDQPSTRRRRRYAESIARSDFVVCPRGGGTSSFRLFESMMLGRAPVIVSDQWVPPVGPDWETFSVRVDERDIADIPELLEARRFEAKSMGRAARLAWEDWFSDSVAFNQIVSWCLELHQLRSSRRGVATLYPYAQMLRPYHSARWFVRKIGHGSSWRVPRPSEVAAGRERRRNERAPRDR